jgi:linoleoyl-CoA desaturase
MQTYEKRKLKYETKDTELVFKTIRSRADQYFTSRGLKKNASGFMWVKCTVLILLAGLSYLLILNTPGFAGLVAGYLLLGMSLLTLGINIGHDAAHHCFTGNRKTDDIIFQVVFGIQGMAGYLWQMRHNFSHHIFPNVQENDTDLDLTPLLLIVPKQKVYWFHRYQHIYATPLYGTFSFFYIFVRDFASFFTKDHGNIHVHRIPVKEWVKLFLIKITYIVSFIVIPVYFTEFSFGAVFAAFMIMHFILSVYLSFTFFISHHVAEVDYFDTLPSEPVVPGSWIQHQIITTIDFNPENKLANFLFGGFNLHIAHHVFPEVSHIHYPALTRIIKNTLEENNLDWYKSFTFFKGVRSHLVHLRNKSRELMQPEEYLEETDMTEEIVVPSYSKA